MRVTFSTINSKGDFINEHCYKLNDKAGPYFDKLQFGSDIQGFFITLYASELNLKMDLRTKYLKKEKLVLVTIKSRIEDLKEYSEAEFFLFFAASFLKKLNKMKDQYEAKYDFNFETFAQSFKRFFDDEIFKGKIILDLPNKLKSSSSPT